MQMYGIVSQVSPKVNSRVRKCLRDSIEQIPDYVDLPKSSSAKRIPKSVLARIRLTITNRIFELVREHKLELRTLDSGKIDLALPRGMWSHVFPAVLEVLIPGCGESSDAVKVSRPASLDVIRTTRT